MEGKGTKRAGERRRKEGVVGSKEAGKVDKERRQKDGKSKGSRGTAALQDVGNGRV